MGLKDLKLPEEVVTLPGGDSFTVGGLSLIDVMVLTRSYLEPFKVLFERAASGSDIEEQDVHTIAVDLLNEAPEIAAAIIAHAAGQPDEIRKAKRLPFPTQLDALEKIGKLTFEAEGGPKKVLETVIKVLQGANSLLGDLRATKTGSLE